MSWLLIVIIAHFFYAGIFIIDRYLLKKGFPHPLSYAFWTSILGIFVLLLVPFGFTIPAVSQIIFGLLTGVVWLLATIIFYTALYKGESSRVVPAVGSLIPIFTLILSFIFLGERLNLKECVAFCFLVIGGAVISLSATKVKFLSHVRKIRLTKASFLALGAALFFAIYFVMTKYLFYHQNFVSSIIWIRLGAIFSALFLLLSQPTRKMIFRGRAEIITEKTWGIFLLDKGLGVFAGLLMYGAIFLGSVTIVNALQGVQYLFLLLLAFLLFRKIPSLKEQFDKEVLVQKIFAIILIGIGLGILVL